MTTTDIKHRRDGGDQRAQDIARAVASGFIERAEALGLKGKTRDKAALDYYVGAARALELAGEEKAANVIAAQATMIVCVAGYTGIVQIAGEAQ